MSGTSRSRAVESPWRHVSSRSVTSGMEILWQPVRENGAVSRFTSYRTRRIDVRFAGCSSAVLWPSHQGSLMTISVRNRFAWFVGALALVFLMAPALASGPSQAEHSRRVNVEITFIKWLTTWPDLDMAGF